MINKLTFTLLTAFIYVSINAQNYTEPAEVKIVSEEIIKSSEPAYPFDFPKFYPIGWSANNKFYAYCTEETTDGYGLSVGLHIYDVINKKIVLHYGRSEGSEDIEHVESYSDMWKNNSDTLSEILTQYKIIQEKNHEYYFGNEISVNEEKYTVYCDVEEDTIEHVTQTFMEKKEVNIIVIKAGSGIKNIYHDSSKSSIGNILNKGFYGMVNYPKKRMGIVMAYTANRGWEGGVDIYLTPIFFDLDTGFKWK